MAGYGCEWVVKAVGVCGANGSVVVVEVGCGWSGNGEMVLVRGGEDAGL